MATITVGEYIVVVPEHYSVQEFNQFRDMPNFLRGLPFDWDVIKRMPTVYIVRFGEQELSFCAHPSEDEPEGLAESVFHQTYVRPPLEDVIIHGIPGKAYGSFGDTFSRKDWWLKAPGSHVISFCFQGKGTVSDKTKSEVAAIMNSVRQGGYAA